MDAPGKPIEATAQRARTPKFDSARKPGHEVRALGITTLVTLVIVAVWAAAWQSMMVVSARLTPVPPIYRVAAEHGVSPFAMASGRRVFSQTCSACHGPTGRGIPRLGKPLRNNAFVQSLSDSELIEFIARGRLPTDSENTTGVAMPALGGNPKLTESMLADLAVYMRTIQDPTQPPVPMDDWIVALSEIPAGSSLGGIGHDAFISACSACHGTGGEGLPNLGKALSTSEFVAGKTDEELLKFVKQGRPIWDAENTTGIDMPPKGGNPALSDEQLAEIIAYIRSLHATGE